MDGRDEKQRRMAKNGGGLCPRIDRRKLIREIDS